MSIEFESLVAPVTNLRAGDPLATWHWLVGSDARPLLLTSLGDMFVERANGVVEFIDTYEGSVKFAGADRALWKSALQQQENLDAWFTPWLVEDLREKGLLLATGQCYSAILPPVLGGSMETANFECTDWQVHFVPLGQIHEQVKDLPPGTPISGINIEWK